MERLELLAKARGAYERGRRRLAWRTMLLSVPMAGLALFVCRHHGAVGVPLGMTLVAISAVLAWRGGVAGRAVTTGLLAGLAPMFLPLVVSAGCSISGAMTPLCFPACIVGGLIGGAFVWSRASRVDEGRKEFVLVAGGLASLAGSLGCVVLGVGGVVAMIAALAALSVPAMLVPARSH